MRLVISIALGLSLAACTKFASESGGSSAAGAAASINSNQNALPITGTESNVMAVTVGACGNTLNILCASVTICSPGSTTACQTIPNLLVDTGSYGLRIFSSVVSVALTAQTVGGNNVAECVSYLDGTSDWGSVKVADVYLGNEKAASLPIQLIDSTFGTLPKTCANPETSPADSGFNGVLGVGQFIQDCGPGCAVPNKANIYFTCTAAGVCSSAAVPVTQQVSNPVAAFGTDSAGIAMALPAVPAAGATQAPGYMVFGIATQADNTPGAGIKTYNADSSGNIRATFDGQSIDAFIDSGSNGLFFPVPSSGALPLCSDPLSSFFCPSNLTTLSATVLNSTSTVSSTVSFTILSAMSAFDINNPNYAFDDLGGELDGEFDFGLPFFLGRTVFVGIEGKTSSAGTGPLWAF